jgi:hypothetical protein
MGLEDSSLMVLESTKSHTGPKGLKLPLGLKLIPWLTKDGLVFSHGDAVVNQGVSPG